MGSSTCSRHIYKQIIEGVKEKYSTAAKVYGIAFHKFTDVMYKTGNPTLAVLAAKKAFAIPKHDNKKSMWLSDEGHMLTTCMNVWAGFIQEDSTFDILSVDGKPLTEQTFSIKFYEDEHIIVYLEGTLDKIGKFKNGVFAIGDWKTTSSWNKDDYFTQYELSRQLRLYRLATILESRIAPDSPIGMIGASRCGVFIDAVFLKPERNEVEVKRSNVFQLSDSEMVTFEQMLNAYCSYLSHKIRTGTMLFKEGTLNGSCEGKWGKCPYWNLCKTPPEVAAILQTRDFDIVPWNPQDYNNLNDEV
jgi:hypothetical protein